MTVNLVITAKHLLDELNIIDDKDGRTDHPWQAESCQQLCHILDEFIFLIFINNNVGTMQIQPTEQRFCS
jgi:hypothetical protein